MSKTKKKQKRNQATSLRNKKVPFIVHLNELRNRLLNWLIFLLIASVCGFILREYLINILLEPISLPIYYSSPAGGFSFIIQVSIIFGFVFSLPFLIFQIIGFCTPLFSSYLRKKIWVFIVFSIVLTLLGLVFGYFISLPLMLQFLSSFNTKNLEALISAQDYLKFVTQLIFGFALIFQIPVVIYILNKANLVNTKQLLKLQKTVFVLSFILAAILTPSGDILNQLIMALPIITLYEATLFVIILTKRAR